MTTPTLGDVHVDAPLTNVALVYMQEQRKFVADRVFPVVPVNKSSGIYYEFDKGYWFRDDAKKMAPGAEFPMSGFDVTQRTYATEKYGHAFKVPMEVAANADTVVARFINGAQFVTNKLLIKRERIWAANYWKTGVWSADKVGGTDFTKWSTTATSDPIKDIDDWKREIEQETGFEPNTLVLGKLVYDRLKEHPDLVEIFKYSTMGIVNLEKLAQALEIENVYVAAAVYETAGEGATSSMSYILAPDAALLAYVAPTPSIDVPSAGYTFAWRFPGANNPRINIERIQDQKTQSSIVRGWFYVDMKLVASSLGIFISDAVD